MNPRIQQVVFDNRIFPKAQFDILRIEEVFQRKNLDHSPFSFHRVDFYLMILSTHNQGYHNIDFIEYELKRGTVLTIRKDQIHRFVNKDAKGFVLLFTNSFIVDYLIQLEALKTLQLFNELLGSPKIQLIDAEFDEIFNLIASIQNEYFHKRDEFSLAIIRSLLQVLIGKLFRAKSTRNNKVIKSSKYLENFIQFQDLVEQHCLQTKKVKDYAIMMGITTKTLNNIVHSILNKTAKIFIDETVITQIKRLLIHSNLNIKEIAYQTGFQEPSNLFKYFKKLTGQTPEGFRNSQP